MDYIEKLKTWAGKSRKRYLLILIVANLPNILFTSFGLEPPLVFFVFVVVSTVIVEMMYFIALRDP